LAFVAIVRLSFYMDQFTGGTPFQPVSFAPIRHVAGRKAMLFHYTPRTGIRQLRVLLFFGKIVV